MIIGLLVFFGIFLILSNFVGYPFFLSLFIAIAISGSIGLFINGHIIQAVINFIIWSCALSVYEDGRRLDVKFKFWFALLSFFVPIVGVPVYLILRKKMSNKIKKMIKTEDGSITFYNR